MESFDNVNEQKILNTLWIGLLGLETLMVLGVAVQGLVKRFDHSTAVLKGEEPPTIPQNLLLTTYSLLRSYESSSSTALLARRPYQASLALALLYCFEMVQMPNRPRAQSAPTAAPVAAATRQEEIKAMSSDQGLAMPSSVRILLGQYCHPSNHFEHPCLWEAPLTRIEPGPTNSPPQSAAHSYVVYHQYHAYQPPQTPAFYTRYGWSPMMQLAPTMAIAHDLLPVSNPGVVVNSYYSTCVPVFIPVDPHGQVDYQVRFYYRPLTVTSETCSANVKSEIGMPQDQANWTAASPASSNDCSNMEGPGPCPSG
ncbi:hypothetical protein S7711_10793 [Stachybotrys chartarum IBT 7711]|uniref:Uncharacterized protein n=1 Tax=Stachybotrys chartarum (strain CBS 109288 / IBT 7711) TaxID=1280523 RepID=A0A084AQY7_STACB|nr:hypothetical protein S7711_10793 [Stachybotrys chartarum IBT 7711]